MLIALPHIAFGVKADSLDHEAFARSMTQRNTMKKLPAAIKHCQKIGGALRRRRVSVIAISFNLCTPSLQTNRGFGLLGPEKTSACNVGQRWDVQCDGAHTGLRNIAVWVQAKFCVGFDLHLRCLHSA